MRIWRSLDKGKNGNTLSPPLPLGEGRGEGSSPRRPNARETNSQTRSQLQLLDIRGFLRQIRLCLDVLIHPSAFILHPFPPRFVVLDVLSFVLKSRLRLDGLIRPIPFRRQPYRDSFVLLDVLSFVSGIRLDSRRLGFRARLFFLRLVLNNRLACLFHPCG